MKAFALEDVEMLETIEDCLSILSGGLFFLLKIDEEVAQLIKGHGAIL